MLLKQFTIDFHEIGKDYFLRNDEKYHSFLYFLDWNLFNTNKKLICLREILSDDYSSFNYKDGEEYRGIPTGQTYLDEDGEIKDFQLVTLENHPGRLKYKISNDNILISSLRLAKSPALYFENLDLSNYVFSNGFYIFKVREDWNSKFILFILRTKKLKNILDNHLYRGIGISAYRKDDLLKIEIPLIPKDIQDKVVIQTEPIDKKIKVFKAQIKSPQEIINKAFAQAFHFDLDKVSQIDRDMKFYQDFSNIAFDNTNVRFSYRWNQLERVQGELYKGNKYIQKLGKYIKSTRNGWSPECNSYEGQAVLGVDAIQKDGKLNFENLKYTKQIRNNINDLLIKNGDFFVSRGNTLELVALASVAKLDNFDQEYVYPDLMIKVDLDENSINKTYLACLFNSIIGRIYFKYSAKGKNQTMVKISSKELYDFNLPLPLIEDQQMVVGEIKVELGKQERIKKQIEAERNKIDEIIEKAIS